MSNHLFETAPGVTTPWSAQQAQFDAAGRQLSLVIACAPGSRLAHPEAPGLPPVHDHVASVSIDMSPAFIKGVTQWLPQTTIAFDTFHVVAHTSEAVAEMRRQEQRTDPTLKGIRWALLKSQERLSTDQREDLDALLTHLTTKRDGPGVALPGAAPRHPDPQATQRRGRFVGPVVSQCQALEGGTDESGRGDDPRAF